jgi:peroxiredoxin
MPDLDALGKELASRDVVVLAINVAEDEQTVQTFLEKQNLSLRALLDHDRSVSRKYLVSGIPHTVVIGRDGMIRHVHVGASSNYRAALQEQIEAALN